MSHLRLQTPTTNPHFSPLKSPRIDWCFFAPGTCRSWNFPVHSIAYRWENLWRQQRATGRSVNLLGTGLERKDVVWKLDSQKDPSKLIFFFWGHPLMSNCDMATKACDPHRKWVHVTVSTAMDYRAVATTWRAWDFWFPSLAGRCGQSTQCVESTEVQVPSSISVSQMGIPSGNLT